MANEAKEQIRFSADGAIAMIWQGGEPVRCPTDEDMEDGLPVGEDMTDDEVERAIEA